MKTFIVLFSVISIVYCKTLTPHSSDYNSYTAGHRCINMWDEGCVNGQLGGSGNDDDYLNGGFTPGKRCVNMWDEGCINGQLGGSGNDDDYLNGGFTPGKRCVNMGDAGCVSGQLSATDGDYGYNPGNKFFHDLFLKFQKTRHHN